MCTCTVQSCTCTTSALKVLFPINYLVRTSTYCTCTYCTCTVDVRVYRNLPGKRPLYHYCTKYVLKSILNYDSRVSDPPPPLLLHTCQLDALRALAPDIKILRYIYQIKPFTCKKKKHCTKYCTLYLSCV